MPIYLTEADVGALLAPAEAIECFVEFCAVPERWQPP